MHWVPESKKHIVNPLYGIAVKQKCWGKQTVPKSAVDNLHSNGVIVESNRQTPKLQIKQQLKKTKHQMTSIRANQIISFTRLMSQMWLFLEIIYRVPAYNHRFGTMLNMSIFNHHFWGRKIWAIYKRMKCALLLKGFKFSTSWDGLGWIKHVKTLVNYVDRIWLYTSNISWS